MIVPPSEFCNRAVAYLKVSVSDETEAVTLPDADRPVMRYLGHGLLAAYLVDQGDRFEYVQVRHLAASGIRVGELHRRAVQNLAELAQSKMRVVQHDKIFAVFLGGNFEASLILVDELWDKDLSHFAPSGFVAAVPQRDILVFCDSASDQGIAELRQVVERLRDDPDHPLTPNLLRRQARGWVPYVS